MFCSQCGNASKDSDKYCVSCGSPLNKKIEPEIVNENTAQVEEVEDQVSQIDHSKGQNKMIAYLLPLLVIIVVAAISINSNGDNSSKNTSDSASVANDIIDSSQELVPDNSETLAPDPETGVDISNLPPGRFGTNEYNYGVGETQAFINGSALTRATYDNLGGLEMSCKFVLDSFMALNGGSSTKQQYADFLLGCADVVTDWY